MYKHATKTIPVFKTPKHPRIPSLSRNLFSRGSTMPIPSKVNNAETQTNKDITSYICTCIYIYY